MIPIEEFAHTHAKHHTKKKTTQLTKHFLHTHTNYEHTHTHTHVLTHAHMHAH